MSETSPSHNPNLIARAFAGKIATRAEILNFCKTHQISAASIDSLSQYQNTDRTYNFPIEKPSQENKVEASGPEYTGVRAHKHVRSDAAKDYYVPAINTEYENCHHYDDIRSLIRSKQFLPAIITGLSGNGKTMSVIQACAVEGRELVMVSITSETNEEDLMGSIGLVDGNTVLNEGPVTTAMRRGAILLLDEFDYATSKIACLQNILNGGNYTFKKTGEIVKPAAGFMAFATMNTKGKGSETGQFAFTNVLNEALLDRFPICFEYSYPTAEIEKKILKHHTTDMEFVDDLIKWANQIRESYDKMAIEETISTRRLVNICQMFGVFKNKKKAIEFGVSRMNTDTKASFLQFYEVIERARVTPSNPDNKIGPKTPNPF